MGEREVYRTKVSIAQPDFTAECLSARNAGVEVLVVVVDTNSVGRVAASCARQGYRPTLSAPFQSLADRFKDDPAFDRAIMTSTVAPWFEGNTAASAEYQEAVRRFFGKSLPPVQMPVGWVAGKLLERAARSLQALDSPSLLRGLWSIKNDDLGGLTQPLTFTENEPAPRFLLVQHEHRQPDLDQPRRVPATLSLDSAGETMERLLFDDTHDLFRTGFRAFVEKEILPHAPGWEEAGITDREMFRKAGRAGFLGMAVPGIYGGGETADFRFNVVVSEELARAGVTNSGLSIQLHNDVCLPYFLANTTSDQKARWLPGICSGELMTAIAMSEPGAGSDLAAMRTSAVRDGDDYVLNGTKTFITNGIHSDLVIVACKTQPAERHRGISLLVVEAGMPGFERGRNLSKIGMHANDTAELFFSDVRVPIANCLGGEGNGFRQLLEKLPRERLSIAVTAVAQAEVAFQQTLAYVKEREAFGQPIGSFQHNRFTLAELRTELDIAQLYVDTQVEALNRAAPLRRGRREGQMVDDRIAVEGPRLLRAAPWRVWLHGGVPDRPGVA